MLDGAEHRLTRPYTPEHNGEVERYNRILADEFLFAGMWSSETERSGALTTWNRHYNYHRPYGAHGGEPPASATPLRVDNVLASYISASSPTGASRGSTTRANSSMSNRSVSGPGSASTRVSTGAS